MNNFNIILCVTRFFIEAKSDLSVLIKYLDPMNDTKLHFGKKHNPNGFAFPISYI